MGVPQIVEAALDPGTRGHARERGAEHGRTVRPAREQKLRLAQAKTEVFFGLGDPVRAQHLDHPRRQRPPCAGVRRLRLRLDPRAGPGLLDRLDDTQETGVQIDMGPCQAEQLTPPQAGSERSSTGV